MNRNHCFTWAKKENISLIGFEPIYNLAVRLLIAEDGRFELLYIMYFCLDIFGCDNIGSHEWILPI